MKAYLQEPVARSLPDAASVTIDRQHYYRQFLHGYYQFDCAVTKGVTRSTKFYIPEGSSYNQPTIFLGVPASENTWDFMLRSGWKALADQYGLYLVLMEAQNGKWGTSKEEKAYLDALGNDIALRPMFCAFQANFYAVGYGETADLVGYQSRLNPRAYAAVALLGSSGLAAEEEVRLQTTATKVPGVPYSEVQWPCWLGFTQKTAATERLAAYYKKANHSSARSKLEAGSATWYPEAGGTVDEHWCAKVIVDYTDFAAMVNYSYSEKILTELFDGIYRYPGNNNGALRQAGNIYDRGFTKHTAEVGGGFAPDHSDKYQREWYVYVPADCRSKKNLPAVFVLHGAGGSGDEIADRIGWSYVADKYGILLIMPSASEPLQVREISDIRTNNVFRPMWNTSPARQDRPDDLLFIDYLYKWLLDNYAVDPSCIYASGQSSGGSMSWACAAFRPDYFAAVAPFSAHGFDLESPEEDKKAYTRVVDSSDIAIIANMGLDDAAFKGGYSTAQKFVDFWCQKSRLTGRWADYTYADGGKKCSFKKGDVSYFVFKNQEGMPLLTLTETDHKAHATYPSECETAWHYFTQFTKDPVSKKLIYKQ